MFAELPPKLLARIFSHVTSHSDLLAVSLMSRAVSAPAQRSALLRRDLTLRRAQHTAIQLLLSQPHVARAVHHIHVTSFALPLPSLAAFVTLRYLALWSAEPAAIAALPTLPQLQELLVAPRESMRAITKAELLPVFLQPALHTLILGPVLITGNALPWPPFTQHATLLSLTLLDASVAASLRIQLRTIVIARASRLSVAPLLNMQPIPLHNYPALKNAYIPYADIPHTMMPQVSPHLHLNARIRPKEYRQVRNAFVQNSLITQVTLCAPEFEERIGRVEAMPGVVLSQTNNISQWEL
uniref:F-box domain-containing protein n=1 Tax=Mycena chlorophos TaxID=658473 RepID=A0ABQ0LHF4_MYCCL|nr:predicted protein [Mycena chlorophos]